MQRQKASKTVGTFTSVTLIENERKKECYCLSHALPGSTALCQGVKRRGQKGRQHAYEEVRPLRAPCLLANCLREFTVSEITSYLKKQHI